MSAVAVTAPLPQRPPIWRELAMPVVLAGFGTYLLIGILSMVAPPSTDFPGPKFFPAIIVVGMYALSIGLSAAILLARRRAPVPERSVTPAGSDVADDSSGADGADDPLHIPDDEEAAHRPIDLKSLGWAIGSFAVFALILPYLGWIIAAGLLFWGQTRAFGSKRLVVDFIIGLTASSLVYIAFDMALGLSLPSGILGGGF